MNIYSSVNNMTKYITPLVYLWLMFILSGCGSSKVNELQPGDVILAFGDSLTVGYGVDKQDSYPSILQALSGFKVINAGVSGETTTQGLKRLPETLEAHQPKLVILLEGGNDVLRNQKTTVIKANLESMIAMIHQSGAEVILIGAPEKKLFGSSLDLYSELSDTYQVPLEDDIVASLMRRASMKSDYVHFNEKGYRALAEAVYELMQESGAVSH